MSEDRFKAGRTPLSPLYAPLLLRLPSEYTQRTLCAYDEYGDRSHQYHGCEALNELLVYSLLLTAWAVGYAFRLLLSLNRASLDPSLMPFSEPRPTSAMDRRNTLSWKVSEPPPSTVGFATVRVVVSRAASISGPKPVRKPASPSYSL